MELREAEKSIMQIDRSLVDLERWVPPPELSSLPWQFHHANNYIYLTNHSNKSEDGAE